jgi:hypothetical protein
VFLIASAVQGDSPTRSDAFWASHPFRPSAMVGAKIGFALMLLALALIGQAIGVRSYDVHGLALLPYLITSASFFGAFVLAAMVVAALTRDLRSFALAVIGLVVVAMILSIVDGNSRRPLSRDVTVMLQLLGAAAGLVVLGWLYRTRDGRLRTRLTGFVAATLALLMTGETPAETFNEMTPATVERIPLRLQLAPKDARIDGAFLRLDLVVPTIPPGLRLTLLGPVALVHLRDGSVLRVPMATNVAIGSAVAMGNAVVVVNSSDIANMPVDLGRTPISLMPRMSDVHWVGDSTTREWHTALGIPLTAKQRRLIEAGAASIVLEARVLVRESLAETTMPLVVGSELVRSGGRVRIEQWTHDPGEPALTLHVSTIARSSLLRIHGTTPWERGVEYALLNPVRREALPLHRQSLSTGIDGLVLPGANMESATARYVLPSDMRSPESAVDDAWFRDARLLIVSQVPRGSYPVRLELTLP